MHAQDAALLADIRRRTIDVLGRTIGRGARVALVGAPNQRNVGDSLIWAGEVEYFRALGIKVRYMTDRMSYDATALRAALPSKSGIILIHGGGNFGDLWAGHQEHREQVTKDFPDYRIVQLPQSVFFHDEDRAKESDRILGAHPDFTLLVRDGESRQRAQRQLPSVRTEYCWDMAFGWNPPTVAPAPLGSLLVLARSDLESASGLKNAEFDAVTTLHVERADWQNTGVPNAVWTLIRYVPRFAHKFRAFRSAWFQIFLKPSFALINRINISEGVKLFSGRRATIVDRLHAHVLSIFLDIDHVLVDNNYGKLGAVYNDYSGGFSRAHYVRSADEALAYASTLDATEREA